MQEHSTQSRGGAREVVGPSIKAEPNMKRGVAAAAAIGGHTPAQEMTTEEQARAIMCAARRAAEEEAKRRNDDDGDAGPRLSLKKSLRWFLEGRKNKAMAAGSGSGIHRQLEEDDSMSSSEYFDGR